MNNVIDFKQSVEYYLDWSDKCMDEGKPLMALNSLRHAMKVAKSSDDLEEILLCRALIYADMGRYEDSNESLFELLSNNLAVSDCYFSLAQNFYCLDRNDLSNYYFEKIAEIEPDIPTDAISEYLDLSPTRVYDSSYRVVYPTANEDINRAKELIQQNKINEAIEILKEISKECSNFVDAQNDLSLCYMLIDEHKLAKDTLKNIIQIEPNNVYALCNELILEKVTGTPYDLPVYLEKFNKINDMTVSEKTKIAMTMCDLNVHNEAAKYLEMLFDDRAYADMIMILLGIAYFNLKSFDKSLGIFDKMLKINDKNTVAKFYIRFVKNARDEHLAGGKVKFLEYIPQLPYAETVKRNKWVMDYFFEGEMLELEDESSIESEKLEWLFSTNQVELQLNAIVGLACSNVSRKMSIFEKILLREDVAKHVKTETAEALIGLYAKKISLTIDGRFFQTKIKRPKDFKQMNKVSRSAFCKAYSILIFICDELLPKVSEKIKWADKIIDEENLDVRSFEALAGIILLSLGATKLFPEDILCDILNANIKTYKKYKKSFHME